MSCTVIEIPILISGSPDITGISLRIDYDGNVLSYLQPVGFPPSNPFWSDPALSSGVYSQQNHINTTLRNVIISWSDASAVTIGTGGTGTLFKLLFRYYGGSTTLQFNNSVGSGIYCEYADYLGNPLLDSNLFISHFYVQGSVGPIVSSISGQFLYDNGSGTGTALDSLHLNLLKPPYSYPNDTICKTWTDINGNYTFVSNTAHCISINQYAITAITRTYGGSNGTDALKITQNYLNQYPPNPSSPYNRKMRWNSADVTKNFYVTQDDKDSILARFAGTISSFTRGDWFFEKSYTNTSTSVPLSYDNLVSFTGVNLTGQNFFGLCVGDVNASYIPPQGQKSLSSKVSFNLNDVKKLKPNEYYELPVKVSNNISVAAISLILKYPKNLVEIHDVKFVNNIDGINTINENVIYNINETGLRIVWVGSNGAGSFLTNDVILLIKLTTKSCFNSGDVINFEVVNDQLCELADGSCEPLNNVILNIPSIEYDNSKSSLSVSGIEKNFGNNLQINPNPAKDILNIEYNIAENGNLKISIFNLLGEKILDVVNYSQLKGNYSSKVNLSSFPSGLYNCKLTLNNKVTIIKRFVISN